MHIPKKYIHDRLILMIISVNVFLAILSCLMVTYHLTNSSTKQFWIQYRPSLSQVDAYKNGGAQAFIGFIFFSILVLAFHTLMSIKMYPIKRNYAITVLALGTLLLSLAIIVSNALLVNL